MRLVKLLVWEGWVMQMIKIKMTLVFFVNFFIINNLIFGMKLSEISGIEKLVD